MPLVLYRFLCLVSFSYASATFHFPELKPELEKYQDGSEVYPLTEPFYELYRNYEEDPFLGTAKCVKFSQVGPEEDRGYPILAQWGEDNQSMIAYAKLESSEGYTAKNMVVYAVEGVDGSLPLYVTFLEVGNCGIIRNAYVNEDSCCVVVPESHLGQETVICDFVYDLLCGSYKYQLYDESCKW
ncbi:uncharacterized protein LOC115310295 [Ixodes scapularis]|uniref:uncharacterized protein LOC115310295 n=1 Tax=Ixodes scapularis TaxID=6945 RepID=UPI001A9D00D9|nr:uncharacterized protein LOC115310295 [Ixodes scapularis]